MDSKLGWHFQLGVPGWAPHICNGKYIKVMDPPTENPFPNSLVVGRTYEPDEVSIERIWKGPVGAREWFDRWREVYNTRPYVHAWEGPNEPHPMWDLKFRLALNAFTATLAEIMMYHGFKLVGHNWSVGWPDIGNAVDFRDSMVALKQGKHFLGLHEYAAPTMNEVGKDGQYWWTLRYRKTFEELRSAGIPIPDTLITECGIDGGVWTPYNDPVRPKVGYLGYMDMDAYMANLSWYDGELSLDPEVKGATVFTSTPNPVDWGTFNVEEEMSRKIAHHIDTFVAPAPPVVVTGDPLVIDMVHKLPTHESKSCGIRPIADIQQIVIHHTATPSISGPKFVRRVARYHVNTRDYARIGYHYMIDPDGVIYKTNNLSTVSTHVYRNNTKSVGVCLVGNFVKKLPTDEQLDSCCWLNREIEEDLGRRVPILGHKEVPNNRTACPGAWEDWGHLVGG